MAEKTCAACDCKLDANLIKVTIGGKTVEVCCDECAQRLKEAQAACTAGTSRHRGVLPRRLDILAVSAFALLSALSHGRAAAADTPPSEQVRYADLDLNRPAGIETLYRRLSQSARNVCESYTSSRTRDMQWQRRRCVALAMANAVKDVGNPALTARFLGASRAGAAGSATAWSPGRTATPMEKR
jgi:UrcA family protein